MKTLVDLLQRSRFQHAEVPAVKFGKLTLTYSQLLMKAEKVAACVSYLVGKQARVGIVGQRNLSVYPGIVGSILSGSVYVPINPKFPLNKKLSIIEQAGIKVLIATREDKAEVESLLGQAKIDSVIYPDTMEMVQQGKTYSLNEYEVTPAEVQAQDMAYIMFTSGSTGMPKGVMVSHANVLALMDNLQDFYPGLKPGYKCSQTFDLSFDPSVCDMFFTWKNGGTLCVMTNAEIFMPADYLRREKIEFWHSVPMIAEYLGKLGHLKPEAFPFLKYTVFTGEPCKKTVADAWRAAALNTTIENRYGPTELTVDCLRFEYLPQHASAEFANGLLPIGFPYRSLESRIVNESLELCSPFQKGELVVAGPQVTMGYLNDPEKTGKVFVKMNWDDEGRTWYRTGDSAVANKEGQTDCLGRIDNQIKLAGKRIEIGEIEYSLLSSQVLKEAVVVPYRSAEGLIQGVVAFCERELSNDEISELKNKVQSQLDMSFFPKKFFALKEVPLNPSGKVDRKHLANMAQEMMGGGK
jgi:amino acid adenylation domain-containing protein